jgi:hypothetical protein
MHRRMRCAINQGTPRIRAGALQFNPNQRAARTATKPMENLSKSTTLSKSPISLQLANGSQLQPQVFGPSTPSALHSDQIVVRKSPQSGGKPASAPPAGFAGPARCGRRCSLRRGLSTHQSLNASKPRHIARPARSRRHYPLYKSDERPGCKSVERRDHIPLPDRQPE